jgi:serralysin
MDTIDVASSGDANIDSLTEGPKWASTAITFSFPTSAAQFTGYSSGSEPFNNFGAFNNQQQAAVRWALGQISSFTNLTFTESTGTAASSAVLRFGMSDTPDTAWGYLPDSSDLGGDAWFNKSGGDYNAPVMGNYAWDGIMHEIGHTLGLGHPHESSPPMALSYDWMPYTVMSYRSYYGQTIDANSTYMNGQWGYAQTYMMEDVAALQFMYGANFNFRSTDTVYSWSPTTGEMSVNGVGQGTPGGNAIFTTIWDGGGTDTFDFSNYSAGATIDLRPGSYINLSVQLPDLGAGTAPGNIATTLLYEGDLRSLIENANGTNGDDTIHGNQVANHLVGGGGNDLIYGYDANDTLEGGAGYNQIFGGNGDDLINGGDDNETLSGDDGADHIYGNAGIDLISGGAGNDYIDGGADNDSITGGDGNDTLLGSAGDDTLDGSAGDDTIQGGDGNDHLDGNAGADQMAGGPGDDHYSIDDPADVVIENFGEGTDTVATPFSYVLPDVIENGQLTGIDPVNITGNAVSNTLIGNQANNIIDGGAGADQMRGGYGNDTFYVDNPGDWVFDGGLDGGTDTIYSSVSYVLVERDPNFDPYAGASMRPLADGENHLEFLILTGSGNLDGTGNSFQNTIDGNSGNNMLDGKAGNDTLSGGDGNDLLVGGPGSDTLHGDAGDDGMYLGANLDASDIIDGGAGTDQVGLQGDYSAGLTLTANSLLNVEQLALMAGNDTRFGDSGGHSYSYNLTTVDANVAAGAQLGVNWNTLRAGENVTFNGSAEMDGWFVTYAGQGVDHVTGGQQDDGFFFGSGRWGTGDTVDGQGGTLDELGLQGNYTSAGAGAILFGASQLTGIEVIVCISGGDSRFGAPAGAGYCYDLTMSDGNVSVGQTLYISANTLKAAGGTLAADETLAFNGSAETSGSFVIYSGAGADVITGGGGADTIYGEGGADTIAGGGGSDIFSYIAAADSTASKMDHIVDFSVGDRIDLSRIDAIAGGTNDPFHFIAGSTFSHQAGELLAYESAGAWYVEADIDGDGTSDLMIAVASDHALSGADFVF